MPNSAAEAPLNNPSLFPQGTHKSLLTVVAAAVISWVVYSVLPYDIPANKGLAILLFVAILWFTEALHITVTALIVPVLAAVSGVPGMGTKQALAGFADPIIYIFFGGFALATALHVQKLDRKIALWLISLSRGNMLVSVLALFAVTAFLSMWISNTATTAMMLPLAMGMMSHLDPEKDRKTFVFVLLGIAYASSVGGLGSLVGSPPNAIAAKALGLDFRGWMNYGLPMMLALMPLVLFSMYVVLRPDFSRKVDIGDSEPIPWNLPRLLTLLVFIVTAIAWILGAQIKTTFGIDSPDTVVALAAAVTVVVLGLVTWRDVAANTDWGVLLLFGGGIALSSLLDKSGASLALGQALASQFVTTHPFIVILAVAAFIIMLTEFTSNTASAALLVPVFASIATQLNLPKEALVMVIGIGASCAFMLPVATPPNAIVFGTGLIKQREMMQVGMLLNVLCIILVTLWAYFFLV
ncbi:DASS family sodium-coupled anion symporter [Lautropia mirabilis ATCC 51599]|jgi:transporter, DASS family|uniref:Transporter, DASS family n=1 Tax=Lautropia mirabilis ATCC 51599 TaxID=887898 RepID=E7S0H6_9BURK|nr:DASS family sodium-coupled anion symporter [Lautropia mirabilis]EFV94325.1 transporter, DASS family [Lautropia mirabilis ATCC 51599]VEG99411.1 Na(+)/dicarboxylate symporter [Lautropia mirabilis]